MKAIDDVIEKMQSAVEGMRKQDPDFYAKYPMNLGAVADEQAICTITDEWTLPDEYLYFLKHYVPESVTWNNDEYIGLQIYGAQDLLEGQWGYNYNPVTQEDIPDWPDSLLVIASDEGDPYCIDLSRGDTVIYTAEHGMGTWDFNIAYDNLVEFLHSVLTPPGFDALGLDGDEESYDYYKILITGEGKDKIKTLLFIKRTFSCDVARARSLLSSVPLLVYKGIEQGAVKVENELQNIGADYELRQIEWDEFVQR
ncbi:SMI1/KNR4 family protein [Paenibacillus guangzhouensis]|uniref:SMI1/KNR4 family protein n=1 Tax=Paenibacillus guangzhouensis TaxID=1473112 RepID=UPI001D0F5779|nr:SMI1/KNR4 family protein [Paenibacillus guangzhouensis]